MKKEYRVKSDRDFQRVFQEGASVANRQFVIHFVRRKDCDHYRVGLSVSKRLGNAVMRNRIKRRMRHIMRHLDQCYQLAPMYDMVIIARQSVSHMTFEQMTSSLTHVLMLGELFLHPPIKKESTNSEI
ncbi:ribonuclease P protein component [Allofustis seminis]|uniref:ribonuclease P protein component n=1 Tax=Allofustis seminis TaxID=166939 RepID=UPI00047769E3|nr:ribonuclease P protein component [Allofustis seminis]